MARIFQVSERVEVNVKGFQPWPATIESVVWEENGTDESYHVRLDGSSKAIPMQKEKMKLLTRREAEKWRKMSQDELWHGARKRLEVLEGVYIRMFDEIYMAPPLWNYDSHQSNHELVPDVDKTTLKLTRIAHNAQVRYMELESKLTFHANQSEMLFTKKNETDYYGHVVEKIGRKSSTSQTVIRFPCPMCSKKFKTRMALKKHIECNIDCTAGKKTVKISEPPQQCPKCFALYKNEDLLLKHMVVHEKNLPKKKNGIRDFIRQIMTNNKALRVPAYNPIPPKTKPNVTNGKSRSKAKLPVQRKVDSSDDCDVDDDSDGSSDSTKTYSSKSCGCSSKHCKCKGLIRNHLTHSVREKERRKQMREAFQNLADILGYIGNSSKNTLLTVARREISDLEGKARTLEQTLTDLKDMNHRLQSRENQLTLDMI